MGKYPKEKVPELYAAKRALIAYLKDHNIDPSDTKRIQTDPELRKLVYKLNKERDKVMANYPALDKSNNIKLLKMAIKVTNWNFIKLSLFSIGVVVGLINSFLE